MSSSVLALSLYLPGTDLSCCLCRPCHPQWVKSGLVGRAAMVDASALTTIMGSICATGSCASGAADALVKINTDLNTIRVSARHTLHLGVQAARVFVKRAHALHLLRLVVSSSSPHCVLPPWYIHLSTSSYFQHH